MSTIRDQIKYIEKKREQEHKFAIDVLRHVNGLLPDLNIPQKDIADFVYLTMCGRKDFDMVKASIISFGINSDIHPKEYIIVSDGSWDVEEGKVFFDSFISPLRLVPWSDCMTYISAIYPEMEAWCLKQVWGRKLASIIRFSINGKVLFGDSDVLWFGTPFDRIQLNTLKIKLSTDNDFFYDKKCIQSLGLSHVYKSKYPINCGVVLVGDFNRIITSEARMCMKYESECPGNFSEQTIFAILNMTYHCTWNPNEIKVDISDILADFTSTIEIPSRLIARHYVWRSKWIFWKDYITMRLNMMN